MLPGLHLGTADEAHMGPALAQLGEGGQHPGEQLPALLQLLTRLLVSGVQNVGPVVSTYINLPFLNKFFLGYRLNLKL